jgi:toxin YoeB
MKIYEVEVSPEAFNDIEKHLRTGNKPLVAKIDTLLTELAMHPRIGTGQPERMRYKRGEVWSRRIDRKHRLRYEIFEDKLVVVAISAYGHYDDK